jgi:predicted transcriptional regulator
MGLLAADELKIRVLKRLVKSPELTLNQLRVETGSVNFVSVKRSCQFLERAGLIRIEQRPVGRRKYSWAKITDLGRQVVRTIG